MKTETLKEQALVAIRRVLDDPSIDARQTIEELENLKDEIDEMITSIDVNAQNY